MLIYLFFLFSCLSCIAMEANIHDHHAPKKPLVSLTEEFVREIDASETLQDLKDIIKELDEFKDIKIYHKELMLASNQQKLTDALTIKLEELHIPFDLCQAIKDKRSLFIISLLIRLGAPLEQRDEHKCKPLIHAVHSGDHRIVSLLLHAGANVHAIEPDTQKNCVEIAKDENNVVLAKLINKHMNKMTNLFFNVRTNNQNKIKRFIHEGGNINTIYADQHPLYIAAFNNNFDLVTFLMKNGANINIPNSRGERPIHAAASNNSLDSAKLLLQAGASVLEKDTSGETPLDIAATKKYTQMHNLLTQYVPEPENSSKND